MSVQTVLLDTEPQIYDLVPGIDPGPLLRYNKREYIRGLHCGRLERRSLGSWPVVVRTRSCGMKGCTTSTTSTTTQVTEVVRREWYGDNATAGTWSQPSVRNSRQRLPPGMVPVNTLLLRAALWNEG